MFTSPTNEYLLKKRSEKRSSSRVSPAHTESLKFSAEDHFQEAKELHKKATEPKSDQPAWKGTGDIINEPWPTLKLLAQPDPRGKAEVRPKSANRTRPPKKSSFGRCIPKERPKSAPRARPKLTTTSPVVSETIQRLSTPKTKLRRDVENETPPTKKKENNDETTTSTQTSSKLKGLPAVVFKIQTRRIRSQRRRSTIVTPMVGTESEGEGIGSDNPVYWAKSSDGDIAQVWNAVSNLIKELKGHVHEVEFNDVTESLAVKEWVNVRSIYDDTTILDDYDEKGQDPPNNIFLESDRPPFPTFNDWRNQSQVVQSGETVHATTPDTDLQSHDRCQRLYARSGQIISFDELTAVRTAADLCRFFLSGGDCHSLSRSDYEFILSPASFSTNWVKKVLFRPVSKLIGGILVDIKQARACFRLTGFSANIPPSVALDELDRSGGVTTSNSLVFCDSSVGGSVGGRDKETLFERGRDDEAGTKDTTSSAQEQATYDQDTREAVTCMMDESDRGGDGRKEKKGGGEEGGEGDVVSELGNVSEMKTLDFGDSFRSVTQGGITPSAGITQNGVTQSRQSGDSKKEWFPRSCNCWTFDPSSGSNTYGLITPVAIATLALRHVEVLKKFKQARVDKANDLFFEATQACYVRREQAKVAAMLEKSSLEAANLAEEEATYNAESVGRKIEQHIREPWCKTLWSALWTGKLDTIKECFDGMLDGDIIPNHAFKMFHCEVVFPPAVNGGAPVRITRLDPAGAPETIRPEPAAGDGEFSLFYGGVVRRTLVYSCCTALDAFLCMRKLVEASNHLRVAPPVADAETLPWLVEKCGPESSIKEVIADAAAVSIDGSGSVVDLNNENWLNTSMSIPTLGRQVVLDVPHGLTGEKIEIPITARTPYSSFREIDGEVSKIDYDNCSYLDYSPDNSPLALQSSDQRKNSIEISPIQMIRKHLSEDSDSTIEEKPEVKAIPFLHRRESGTSLWWRLHQQKLQDHAKDSEPHYTKAKPFQYKPMNRPLA